MPNRAARGRGRTPRSAAVSLGYPWGMAKVIEKRPDGSTAVVVPAAEAADLEVGGEVDVRFAAVGDGADAALPWPFGALEVEEVKAARREALAGKAG